MPASAFEDAAVELGGSVGLVPTVLLLLAELILRSARQKKSSRLGLVD
jgi:hypothetical protein